MASLVPFFKELEAGVIVFLWHCVSQLNPRGAALLKGGFSSFDADFPEGNKLTATKNTGGARPLRHVTTHESRIPDATKHDVILDARTHDVHIASLSWCRTRANKTQQGEAATALGIVHDSNTAFLENITNDFPQQMSQVCSYVSRTTCIR